MVWVLWDILIPLLTSFALGTLLAWLIWWRRQHDEEAVVTASATTASGGMAFDAESVSQGTGHGTGLSTDGTDSSTDSELEAANIVLIGERDKAALELEKMQEEADVMQQRIAELEATDSEKINQTAVSGISVTAPEDVALSAGINTDNRASEELQRVQTDLELLNDTLDKERKARRATELELLNAKNRHEKFVAETKAQVSEEQHQREITERDAQIDKLKQQLADRDDSNEDAITVDAGTVETSTVEIIAEDATAEAESQDDNLQAPLSENQGATKNGYKPSGWSVPATAPDAKERDKLTAIKGVGKVLEKILHDCGIYFYHQLANLDKDGMEELQAQIPQFPGRIQRDSWVEQAKELQQAKKIQQESELVEG